MTYIKPIGAIDGNNTVYTVPLAIGAINTIVVDGTQYPGTVTVSGKQISLSSAPVASIYVDYSTVSAVNSTIITLAEFKAAKGIYDTFNDAQFSALIPMTCDLIEKYCHRKFGVGTFTQKRDGTTDYSGRFFFQVDNPPIIELLEANVLFYGTQQTLPLDVTRFDVYNDEGFMYYSYAFMPLQGIIREEYRDRYYSELTYLGGRPVPAGVKLAAVESIWDMFQYLNTTRMASGVILGELQKLDIGDYSESYQYESMFKYMNSANSKDGFLFSKTIKSMLDPYVRHGQSN